MSGLNMDKLGKFDWALSAILVVGFLVRCWGVKFGLPHPDSYPDQSFSVQLALGFFSGDLNPHVFSYPSLYPYLLFFAYSFYFLTGKVTGKYSSTSDFIGEFISDPTNFYLISRGISVLLGTATILIVYKISITLFNRKIALVSSLFLSLAFLHVRDSHFGLTDIPMIFLLSLSILFIVKTYYEKFIKSYLVSGILSGLATSIKYNSVLLVVPMTVVHCLNVLEKKYLGNREEQSVESTFQLPDRLFKFICYGLALGGLSLVVIGLLSERLFTSLITASELSSIQPDALERAERVLQAGRSLSIAIGVAFLIGSILFSKIKFLNYLLDKRIVTFSGTFVCSFLLGTPFALFDFLTFAYGFLVESVVNTKSKGVNLGIGWWYHFKFTLPLGLGWALFTAALLGIVLSFSTQPKKAAILFSFPLVYYFLAGKGYSVYVRYMTPIVPFACIAAAIFVIWGSERLSKHFPTKLSETSITLFLTTLIIFQSAYTVSQFNWLISQKDNRLIAAEWVNKNLPRNASFYQTGAFWGHSDLYPLYRLERDYKKSVAKKRTALAELIKARISYLEETNSKSLQEWEYDSEQGLFRFDEQEQTGVPDYIIRQEYPVLVTNPELHEKIDDLLRSRYQLRETFETIDMDNQENSFDQADAFYAPFGGFKGIQRPGPNIYIYEKRGS